MIARFIKVFFDGLKVSEASNSADFCRCGIAIAGDPNQSLALLVANTSVVGGIERTPISI